MGGLVLNSADEKSKKRLINSISYSILQYRILHGKEPSCILLNNAAYQMLMQSQIIFSNIKPYITIYGICIKISKEITDELHDPRFWLCEEGTIYNYDMDEK